MTQAELQTVSAGNECDITIEVCGNGEIELAVTDGAEAMYGTLDVEGAEALIEMLQRAVRAARG